MSMWIIQHIFVIVFVGTFTFGLGVIGYVAASLLCMVVRMFKPGFADAYVTPAPVEEQKPEQTRMLAIDYLMAERRKLLKVLNNEHHVSSTASIHDLIRKRTDAHLTELDLESVSRLIAKPPPQVKLDKHLANQAEYHLMRFPEGMSGPARFMCSKRITRDGTKYGFAAIQNRALKFDLAAAQRLSAILPDVYIGCANAAARVRARKTEGGKQHETASA